MSFPENRAELEQEYLDFLEVDSRNAGEVFDREAAAAVLAANDDEEFIALIEFAQKDVGFETELHETPADDSDNSEKDFIDEAKAGARAHLKLQYLNGDIDEFEWDEANSWLDTADARRALGLGFTQVESDDTATGKVDPTAFGVDVADTRVVVAQAEVGQERLNRIIRRVQIQERAVEDNFNRLYDERFLGTLEAMSDGRIQVDDEAAIAAEDMLRTANDPAFRRRSFERFKGSLNQQARDARVDADLGITADFPGGTFDSDAWRRTVAPVDFLMRDLDTLFEEAFAGEDIDIEDAEFADVKSGIERTIVPARQIETQAKDAIDKLRRRLNALGSRLANATLNENLSEERREINAKLLQVVEDADTELETGYAAFARVGNTTDPIAYLNQFLGPDLEGILGETGAASIVVPGDIIGTLGALAGFELPTEEALRLEAEAEAEASKAATESEGRRDAITALHEFNPTFDLEAALAQADMHPDIPISAIVRDEQEKFGASEGKRLEPGRRGGVVVERTATELEKLADAIDISTPEGIAKARRLRQAAQNIREAAQEGVIAENIAGLPSDPETAASLGVANVLSGIVQRTQDEALAAQDPLDEGINTELTGRANFVSQTQEELNRAQQQLQVAEKAGDGRMIAAAHERLSFAESQVFYAESLQTQTQTRTGRQIPGAPTPLNPGQPNEITGAFATAAQGASQASTIFTPPPPGKSLVQRESDARAAQFAGTEERIFSDLFTADQEEFTRTKDPTRLRTTRQRARTLAEEEEANKGGSRLP